MIEVGGLKVDDVNHDIGSYMGTDFKNVDVATWLQFAKANKSFGEPGIAYDELRAMHEAMESLGQRPVTILETGQCYGTTTRYFVVRIVKHGGELYSCEINVREPFKLSMEKLGLYQRVRTLGHSMKVPWDKDIDFLFIDSEHALSDALGEYMRFRVWLRTGGIVGFHDTDCCRGVEVALDIIQQIDKLILVSESTNKSGAGIKFFRLDGLGVAQVQGKLHGIRKE